MGRDSETQLQVGENLNQLRVNPSLCVLLLACAGIISNIFFALKKKILANGFHDSSINSRHTMPSYICQGWIENGVT